MKQRWLGLAWGFLVYWCGSGATGAQTLESVLRLGEQQAQSCALCHGPDGKGAKAADLQMAPGLTESVYVRGDYPELLAALILKGIRKETNDFLQVMLPLEQVLDDEKLAAVITYMRKTHGGRSEVISAEEVAGWRQKYAGYQMLSRADLEALRQELEPKPQLLREVDYALYEGSWEKLPDFAALSPTATGTLPDGLVSLDPAKDLKKPFGMVFRGTLDVPKTGMYEFLLASDDGVRLILDGEGVLEDDGIHPVRVKTAKLRLEEGEHRLELAYFDHGGERALSLVVRGGGLGAVPLSSWVHRGAAGKLQPPPPPIVLMPEQPGEATLYRNFLQGASPRAIGVGYPGEVNICWDADLMNLAMVWRGPFLDASRHWTNRGQGNQPPLGYDVVQTGWGLPIQVLASMDEPWASPPVAEMAIDRDVPLEEMTTVRSIPLRHPDYQFLGYRLDAKRFPTFRYRFRDLEVEERFAPFQVDGDSTQGTSKQGLLRAIRVQGSPPENTFFRLADGGSLAQKNDWFDVSGPVKLMVDGAEAVVREPGDQKELLVRLTQDEDFRVIYWWPVQVVKP